MDKVAELADVRQAGATWAEGQLRIQVAGEVHESCWSVDIEQSPMDIWPPQYVVSRHRTSSICAEVFTRYVAAESFTVGSRPESVVLHHAGGEMEVRVEDGPAPAARLPQGDGGFDEAEGRSRRRFSFDEAFANAVEALPFRPSEIADWMDVVSVTDIWAELGGIAGSHDLVVKVRRAHPPS
ncbi:MAG TPA: hypothetical protein VF587_00060 [Solirubrobacteraceae bacterium]|jgi:hypothetical protein